MAKEVRLPRLGETMEEGIIISCLVKVSDEVEKGDVIFEIETDKATLEMESPDSGFVKYILVEADQTVQVGAPILVLGGKDEKVPQSFVDKLRKETPAVQQATSSTEKIAETAVTPGLANKELEETEAKPRETIPLSRLQKITAQRMLQSKREIPCFYLTVKVDVTELVKLRNRLNKPSPSEGLGKTSDVHPVRNSMGNNMRGKGKISNGVKVSYNDFIIKAVATGLEKFPIMTGQSIDDSIQLAEAINIGFAIAVPGGLVAPIVKDVNKKDIFEIARDSKALIENARSNRLAPTDLEGGCITVSNLGAFGIESFIPIVVPGQCSILGIGQIIDTCVPDDDSMVVRKIMNMTLSVDHKVANGAYAAQFLDFVRKLLEDISAFE